MKETLLVNFAWDIYYNAIHLKKIGDGKEVIDFDEDMTKKLAQQWSEGKRYESYCNLEKSKTAEVQEN